MTFLISLYSRCLGPPGKKTLFKGRSCQWSWCAMNDRLTWRRVWLKVLLNSSLFGHLVNIFMHLFPLNSQKRPSTWSCLRRHIGCLNKRYWCHAALNVHTRLLSICWLLTLLFKQLNWLKRLALLNDRESLVIYALTELSYCQWNKFTLVRAPEVKILTCRLTYPRGIPL